MYIPVENNDVREAAIMDDEIQGDRVAKSGVGEVEINNEEIQLLAE
jgi:hypothetical protein